MNDMLVGYTGFVGSNILKKHDFKWKINTKNKEDAYDKNPELLIYAGVRAEKYLANVNSEEDKRNIENAFLQIQKINAKKLVLISTVDVYKVPVSVNEDSKIEVEELQAYGANRYLLEQLVREYKKDALIIRLPGLFGDSIKKNFIYDYIHYIPQMLKEEKFLELSNREKNLRNYYSKMNNGFYKCNLQQCNSSMDEIKKLRRLFEKLEFSALNFTDSRNVYQFYNLEYLWGDIKKAVNLGIPLLNITTEPVSVKEIYRYLTGKEFENKILNQPVYYNFKSKYSAEFGGKDGYFRTKENVLTDIGEFVKNYEIINI